jgi:hypothetical protein
MQHTMSTTTRRMMLAKQMTTPMLVMSMPGTTMRTMVVETKRILAKITTTKPSKAMLATTRRMEGKTTTRQMTMAMLVGAVTKKTMPWGQRR